CRATCTCVWPSELEFADHLNAEIWAESPVVQRTIQDPGELQREEAVGAQQAMLEERMVAGVGRDTVLPWVPDLLGLGWRHIDGLLVIGSSYAGFIKELSRRPRSLPLVEYASASSAEEFQRRFLEYVVTPDASYYG